MRQPLAHTRVLITVLGLTCLNAPSSEAWAQMDPNIQKLMGEPMEAKKEAPVAVDQSKLARTELEELNLQVDWRLFKTVLDAGGDATPNLSKVRETGTSIGHYMLPARAWSATSLIERRVRQGVMDPSEAAEAMELVEGLARELPYPTLSRAYLVGTRDIGKAFGLWSKGIRKAAAWPETAYALQFNLIVAALLGVLLASLMYTTAHLLRYFSVFASDLLRVLPRGFSSAQAAIVIVALICVPALLMQSPLLAVFILLALFSSVQQLRERLPTLLIFSTLAALPAAEAHLSTLMSWNEAPARQWMQDQYTHCDDECTQRLVAERDELGEPDPLLDYTLMLAHFRAGRDAQVSDLVQAEAVATWPAPLRAYGLNVLGAATLALGDTEASMPLFEQAERLDPLSPQASLNRMHVFHMLQDQEQAAAAYEVATARDEETTRWLLAREHADVNAVVFVAPAPLDMFTEHAAANPVEVRPFIAQVWPFIAGPRIPMEWALYLGVLGVFVCLASIPLAAGRRISTVCPSCGLARDPEAGKSSANHPYCTMCYTTLMAGASMSYDERNRNEARIHSRRSYQSGMRRLLSVIPGAGHIFAGWANFGFLLVFLVGAGSWLAFNPHGLWRPADALLRADWFGTVALGFSMLGFASLFGAYGLLRDMSQAPVRTRQYDINQHSDDAAEVRP
ncbi:MAG: hypothetical protein AAGI01_03650 [Myxococcota bacterium]